MDSSNSRLEIGAYTSFGSSAYAVNSAATDTPPLTGWTAVGGGDLDAIKEVHNITYSELDDTVVNATTGLELSHRYDKDGYSLAKLDISNIDGIPTIQYTFLVTNSVLSESLDTVGSQLAIVREVFDGTPATPTGYSIADQNISSVDGIPTRRFRFLKDDVQLSQSVDEGRADKLEVQEWFKPSGSRATKTDYTLDKKDESNVGGIPTERYTFRKTNAKLNLTNDLEGGQSEVVVVKYNGDPTTADVESFTGDSGKTYVIARKEKRGKEITYSFKEKQALVSVSEDEVDPENTVINEFYSPTDLNVHSRLNNAKDSQGNALTTAAGSFVTGRGYIITFAGVTSFTGIGASANTAGVIFIATGAGSGTGKASEYFEVDRSTSNFDGHKTVRCKFSRSFDKIEYSENNRLKLTRVIYAPHNYNYASAYVVGTSTITANALDNINHSTLMLIDIKVDQRNSSSVPTKLILSYTETGEDSREIKPGPTNIPGTEKLIVKLTGTLTASPPIAETPDIKLISKSTQNINGYPTHVLEYIKGTDTSSVLTSVTSGTTYKIKTAGDYSSKGGSASGVVGEYFKATGTGALGGSLDVYAVSTIIGTKNTYSDVVSVDVPGTVQCNTQAASVSNLSGTQGFLKVTPTQKKKVSATVTQSIATSMPSISTLAYNLDGISCSVTSVNESLSEAPGQTVSAASGNTSVSNAGFTRNASISTRNNNFPGHYLIDPPTTIAAVAANAIEAGFLYRIVSTGTTDFTAIGSANSSVNTYFTATGAGSGSGTAKNIGSIGAATYTSSTTYTASGATLSSATGTANAKTRLIPFGTTSQHDGSAPASYSTTGTIQQKARPILTCIDGTVFYEVITFAAS